MSTMTQLRWLARATAAPWLTIMSTVTGSVESKP